MTLDLNICNVEGSRLSCNCVDQCPLMIVPPSTVTAVTSVVVGSNSVTPVECDTSSVTPGSDAGNVTGCL